MDLPLMAWSGSAVSLVVLVAKATLLLLAALGVTALLQRAPAGARHIVWVGIVTALLVLPGLSAWSPLRFAILPASITAPLAPEVMPPAEPVQTPIDRVRIPTEALPPAGPTGPAAALPRATIAFSPWQIALLVWGVIAAGLCAWLVYGFVSVRRIAARGRALTGRDWTTPLYEIADRLGIDEAPRLVRSDAVKMPFASGLFGATIVLPAESDDWNAERRSAVLMHELAHIRRRDLLGHTLGRVACALYWFHPLVWTAARRLRIESERACDDLALTCGLQATNYAEHLLDIVSGIRHPHTPAAAIPMAHRREFEGRMLAILDPDLRRHAGRWQSLALVGSLAAMVLVIGAAAPAQRQPVSVADTSRTQQARPAPDVRTDTNDADVTVALDRGARAAPARDERAQVSKEPVDHAAPAPPSDAEDLSAMDLRALAPVLQGRPADDRAKLLMQVVLNDSSASLRRIAAWGLRNYADRAEVGTALAAALIQDANADVREMAAWALASGEDSDDATKALSNALIRDRSPEVREMAAWALGNLGAENAVDALSAAALRDSSADLRATAIWALGNGGLDDAPPVLLAALSDRDKGVRMLAAWALFHIGDADAAPALEAALNKETEKGVRMSYIRALGAIGAESAGTLARLIDSPDPEIRAVVVKALAGEGGGPWPWPQPRPRPNP